MVAWLPETVILNSTKSMFKLWLHAEIPPIGFLFLGQWVSY